MCTPWYQDFGPADLPRYTTDSGVSVMVIAGSSHGVAGAVTRDATAPLYLDIHLPAGTRFEQALPSGHNAFVYVYRGEASIAGSAVPRQRMAILANDAQADGVIIEAQGETKALLVAGRPLGEPIAQYGPFVMNTQDEIHQAMADYRDGRLGTAD
jgi:redox-sensitive bicupin YhaK (pirin superfamily)